MPAVMPFVHKTLNICRESASQASCKVSPHPGLHQAIPFLRKQLVYRSASNESVVERFKVRRYPANKARIALVNLGPNKIENL